MGGDFLCIPVAEIAMFEDLNPPRTHSGSAALRGASTSLSRRFPWTRDKAAGRGNVLGEEAAQVLTRRGSGGRPAGERWQPPRLTVFVSVPISSAGPMHVALAASRSRRAATPLERTQAAEPGGAAGHTGRRAAGAGPPPEAARPPGPRRPPFRRGAAGQGRSGFAPAAPRTKAARFYVRADPARDGGGDGGEGGEVLPLGRRFRDHPGANFADRRRLVNL